MKKFLCVAGMLICAVLAMQAAVVTYTPDNTTVFRNPERGFTEELSAKVSVSHPYVIKNEMDDEWGIEDKMTLAVVLYNFGNFKSQDLPTAILNAFDEDMQVLRSNGMKCVLRFAYSERESDKVDATPAWVKRHLEQLNPHLAANADVIYVIEAGFVGVWGEWYYTANYGNESQHMNENRRKVIQYLFENVPTDRFVLFRYPMLKTEYFGSTTPLSASEGFNGSMRARWGCHNDAFLHDWGNMGTYASDEEDDDPLVRQYIAAETLYVPNGGETNIDDDDALAAQRYTQAPSEMSTYHWSFCGSSYAEPVTDRWRSSGLFDTLNIHMGYRYNLLDGQFSDQAAPGGVMNVTIRLRNDGYAPIYNERPVYLVLRAQSNPSLEYRLPISSDPRRWLPNGVISVIDEQLPVSSDILEGTYKLYLYLPDKYASIASDPRYAIRCANVNMWESATGYNYLGASVVISQNAPLNPEGMETIQGDNIQRTKEIKDGQFFVVQSDGTRYTLTGQKVK
ncbi:MAG: DUF4832 domain-containing protein [Paludibacteraceae bacterium]|nr:DUF4832 domain-containing protein [Paludibacteraceae bacterium]